MLSAFTARPIVELKQRDKSKIESLLAYGDRLLVGLSTGSLRIYRVNETTGNHGPETTEIQASAASSTKAVELLREEEKFSRYKIEQLAIIKEARILISLSNGYVSIHDLQTYELQETLTRTKGATVFAATSNIVKDESGVPSIVSRLAVAVKRRLLLWSWHDSELSSETLELTLVTGIKTLTWATGTKLVAGLSSSYVLVDVESSEITDIVGPGSIGGAPGQDGGRFGGVGVASMGYIGMGGMIPKPLATKLSEGQLLLAKDINTLFIDTEGKPLNRRQIPWSVAPEAIGYSYPFLLALQATKGTLEIRNPETLNSLQSIVLPNANQLHVSQPNISLAHAGKGFLVSSERCIWRMGALGYDDQIDALVERKRLDEALSLLGMLEDALLKDKQGRLREINMLKAHDLFERKKYRESLDIFREYTAPPERVIELYPAVISGKSEPFSTTQQTDNFNDENHKSKDQIGAALIEQKSIDASGPIVVAQAAQNTDITSPQNLQGSEAKDGDNAATRSHLSGPIPPRPEVDSKDLKTATSELAGFLVDARTKLQRYLNPDGSFKEGVMDGNDSQLATRKPSLDDLLGPQQSGHATDRHQRLLDIAKLVDTTLFRAYMLAQPTLVGALFRLPNFCDADVVKEKLLENGRYNDLIDFFYGKHLHWEALDMLQRFGQSNEGDDTPPQLRGPQRTVGYLQNLPPEMIDIILQYVEWPIRRDPDLGMQVFLADTENAETLPRSQVLDFLQKIDRNLAVRYLVHIIDELGDSTPEFHQRLLEIYLNALISNEFQGTEEKAEWKEKFLDFLRTSQHYEAWTLLRRMPSDDPNFYEARAIVLGKMNEHRRALDIYVFKLGDPAKAEDYCNQIYLKDTLSPASSPARSRRRSTTNEDGPPSIYQSLLSLYLSPPPPHEPQWEPALELLAKHGSRLPASSTLDLIPEVLPVKKLESYFRARIRAANTIVNEGRIVAGLRKTLNVAEEAKLNLGDGTPGGNSGRNRSVVITEERLCGVCHKRFGGSVIKVLPSNAVVHYGCTAR